MRDSELLNKSFEAIPINDSMDAFIKIKRQLESIENGMLTIGDVYGKFASDSLQCIGKIELFHKSKQYEIEEYSRKLFISRITGVLASIEEKKKDPSSSYSEALKVYKISTQYPIEYLMGNYYTNIEPTCTLQFIAKDFEQLLYDIKAMYLNNKRTDWKKYYPSITTDLINIYNDTSYFLQSFIDTFFSDKGKASCESVMQESKFDPKMLTVKCVNDICAFSYLLAQRLDNVYSVVVESAYQFAHLVTLNDFYKVEEESDNLSKTIMEDVNSSVDKTVSDVMEQHKNDDPDIEDFIDQ